MMNLYEMIEKIKITKQSTSKISKAIRSQEFGSNGIFVVTVIFVITEISLLQ